MPFNCSSCRCICSKLLPDASGSASDRYICRWLFFLDPELMGNETGAAVAVGAAFIVASPCGKLYLTHSGCCSPESMDDADFESVHICVRSHYDERIHNGCSLGAALVIMSMSLSQSETRLRPQLRLCSSPRIQRKPKYLFDTCYMRTRYTLQARLATYQLMRLS
jgi:hypothetical protein